jgi:predicted phage-related endonuclease
VPYNVEFSAKLITAEAALWDRIQTKRPPLPIGSDADDDVLQSMYPSEADTVVELPFDMAIQAEEYHKLSDISREADTRRSAIAQQFKQLMGDSKRATVGHFKATWSRFDRESFDSAAFKAENPGLASKYVKRSPSGRFTISGSV